MSEMPKCPKCERGGNNISYDGHDSYNGIERYYRRYKCSLCNGYVFKIPVEEKVATRKAATAKKTFEKTCEEFDVLYFWLSPNGDIAKTADKFKISRYNIKKIIREMFSSALEENDNSFSKLRKDLIQSNRKRGEKVHDPLEWLDDMFVKKSIILGYEYNSRATPAVPVKKDIAQSREDAKLIYMWIHLGSLNQTAGKFGVSKSYVKEVLKEKFNLSDGDYTQSRESMRLKLQDEYSNYGNEVKLKRFLLSIFDPESHSFGNARNIEDIMRDYGIEYKGKDNSEKGFEHHFDLPLLFKYRLKSSRGRYAGYVDVEGRMPSNFSAKD